MYIKINYACVKMQTTLFFFAAVMKNAVLNELITFWVSVGKQCYLVHIY